MTGRAEEEKKACASNGPVGGAPRQLLHLHSRRSRRRSRRPPPQRGCPFDLRIVVRIGRVLRGVRRRRQVVREAERVQVGGGGGGWVEVGLL